MEEKSGIIALGIKMKKINLIIMILGMIAIVSAVSLSLSNVSYDLTPVEKATPETDTITFSCDGNSKTISSNEPDGKYDENDLLSAVKQNCSGVVTNIQMDGDYWQENEFGLKSFDEDELKADICSHAEDELTSYDSKTKLCIKPEVSLDVGL